MCFSAEASFSIGTVLTVIGAVGCKKIKKWPLKFLAIIPLFFAVQQFSEGFVWLYLNNTIESPVVGHISKLLYLLFAWVFWPLYIPFAFYLNENERWRKALCLVCFAVGLLVLYVDGMFLYSKEITATIVGHSVYYTESPTYAHIIYGFSVIIPMIFSGINKMWIVGFSLLASFIASQIIYTVAFTSVWCFFAAAVSILLIRVLLLQEGLCTTSIRTRT